MNIIRNLYRILGIGFTLTSVKPSIDRLRFSKSSNSPRFTRIKLFKEIISIWWKLSKQRKSVENIDSFVFSQGTGHEFRKLFINHYKEQVDNVIYSFDNDLQYYTKLDVNKKMSIFKLTIRYAFMCLSTRLEFEHYWLVKTYRYLTQVELLKGECIDFYMFYAYLPESYITSIYLSETLKEKVYCCVSSSTMSNINRYFNCPNLELILCSKYQVYEHDYFRRLSWHNVKNVSLWGLEELEAVESLVPQESEFDIGIYSSAEWARKEGLFRKSDIEIVEAQVYKETNAYIIFEKILKTVVALLDSFPELRIVIYPHPFERKLINKYNLYPPYYDWVKEVGIEFNLEGKSSLKSIYKSKIGVGQFSTILMDRWHLGLKGFVYSTQDKIYNGAQVINREYIGEYDKYCYSSLEELKIKLEKELLNA